MTAAGATLAEGTLRRPSLGWHNRVLPVLFIVSAAAEGGSGFLTIAPNRLLSGKPIGLLAAAPLLGWGVVLLGGLLLASSLLAPVRGRYRASAGVAALLLLLVLLVAGQGAAEVAAGAPPLARVSLGPAFWVLLGTGGLAAIDGLQRARAGPGERLAIAVAVAVGAWLLARGGSFEALSIAREYHIRQALFAGAVGRHALLVIGSVGPAILIGFPLGVAAVRRPQWQAPLFAGLNLLQTIPSIALFGLLLAPLSALTGAVPLLGGLGIGGVGPAPAIIALILYALLPVVRNTVAGIGGVEGAVLDAARGLGMTQRQRFWRVELPLAAPLLLAGLRIVLVQSIGLAVVAALIGAGGLGTFVFEGLGQYAVDLVLLGAVPAILLALTANFLLQLVIAVVVR